MNKLRCKYLLSVVGLAGVFSIVGTGAAQAESLQTSSQLIQSSTSASEPIPASELSADRLEASALQTETLTAQAVDITPDESQVAQTSVAQNFAPGRATRSGESYVAVGGNIGFGGSTGVGRGNVAITSKIGLTNNFSARPGVLIGDRATFLAPVTVDFPTASVVDNGRVGVAPFVGGGVAISTGSDSLIRPMITAGVDIPITNQITGVASANVGFFRQTDVGLVLGVGYNF